MVVDFAGLDSYPRLLGDLSRIWGWRGYSPFAFALALGFGEAHARECVIALSVLLLGLIAVNGFRRSDGDWRAFVLAVALSLVASPIVWTHYLVILMIPIAVSRPRLSPLWFLPIAFWPMPVRSDGALWLIAATTALTTVILLGSVVSSSAPHPVAAI